MTRFPRHLPRQVLGLVNGYILHEITDPQVISSLQRTAGGVDDGLQRRRPNLAPGQAIVAFLHLARPLLVSIDPAPAKLRLIDRSARSSALATLRGNRTIPFRGIHWRSRDH